MIGHTMQNKDNPIIFIGLTKKELHQVLLVLRDTLDNSEGDHLQDAYDKVSDAYHSFSDK